MSYQLLHSVNVPQRDDDLVIVQLEDGSYLMCWKEDLPICTQLVGTIGYWVNSDDLLYVKEMHEEWVEEMSSKFLAGIQAQARAAGYDRQSFEKWLHNS